MFAEVLTVGDEALPNRVEACSQSLDVPSHYHCRHPH